MRNSKTHDSAATLREQGTCVESRPDEVCRDEVGKKLRRWPAVECCHGLLLQLTEIASLIVTIVGDNQ